MSVDATSLIAEFEGFSAEAYLCPAGVWTIGYGQTGGIKRGMTCTKVEAMRWLSARVKTTEREIRRLVRVPINANQMAALVSFVYNVGIGAFKRSSLFRLLNAGRYAEAADQLLRWDKAGGKVLPGLTRRRIREREIFLTKEAVQ